MLGKIKTAAKLIFELVGGLFGFMSGAVSIPLMFLALFIFPSGHDREWFAILAFCALWGMVFSIGWKNYKLLEKCRGQDGKLLLESEKNRDLSLKLASESQKLHELSEKSRALDSKLEVLLSRKLDIEFDSSNSRPAKSHLFRIIIRNQSQAQNADDLNVQLISFKDDSGTENPNAVLAHFHPKLPLALNPVQTTIQSINPGDGLDFVAFSVQMGTKITGKVRQFMATFNTHAEAESLPATAVFLEGKKYPIKFAASAREAARIEREFEMEFYDENGMCRFHLIPVRELTEAEKQANKTKADKAVEELVKFGQSIASRISHIKGIEATKYNPDTDNETWDVIHQTGAYIALMLTQDAAKVFDSGVFEIHGSMLPHAQHGSTRYEDGLEQTLARLGRRFVNLKTLIDGIDKFIK